MGAHNFNDKRKIICKLSKLIKRKTHVFISGLFMFFSHFQPIRKYLWIVKKEWSNVGRIIMRIQQLGISHLEALKIIKFVRFSQSRK